MIFHSQPELNKSVSPQAADHFHWDAPPWGIWFRILYDLYDVKLEKIYIRRRKKAQLPAAFEPTTSWSQGECSTAAPQPRPLKQLLLIIINTHQAWPCPSWCRQGPSSTTLPPPHPSWWSWPGSSPRGSPSVGCRSLSASRSSRSTCSDSDCAEQSSSSLTALSGSRENARCERNGTTLDAQLSL